MHTREGGRGFSLSNSINPLPITLSEKISTMAKTGYLMRNFLVFNRRWEESDMDAEDLAKAALGAIDDWLDEEIVGFEWREVMLSQNWLHVQQ